jgi:hypothetical protein
MTMPRNFWPFIVHCPADQRSAEGEGGGGGGVH